MTEQHISTFLSSSRGDAPSTSANKKKTLESIEYLVGFMQQDEVDEGDTKEDNVITKEDVATLLLSWSIAHIMRKLASTSSDVDAALSSMDGDDDDDVIGWRVLSCCLDILLLSSSSNKNHTNTSSQTQPQHETLLASSLPQGTLSRSLSYAAHITFVTETTNYAQKYASNCYHHLTKRYHPTLDNASTLLHKVDELLSTSAMMSSGSSSVNKQQHKTIVINSTLQLISRQMIKSNPRKMFGTICHILPYLGRILLLGGDDNDKDRDEDTSRTKDLVQNIVWEGLFNVAHHMEGFRSMGELQFVPTLSKHKGVGKEGLANDINASNENKESPKPKKKRNQTKQDDTEVRKKKKISFQSSLFNTVSNLLSPSSTTVDSDSDSEGTNEEVKTKISAINDAIATANILPIIIQGFFERIRVHASSPRAGSGGGSSTSEGDANVQFRFWCYVILPVFEQLFHSIHSKSESSSSVPLLHSDELSVALLKTISTTLGFVLKYDAYLPSYNDPNEQHLRFLESITSGLLQYINTDMQQLMEEGEEGRQNSESQLCVLLVTSLHNILLLNHRLLHEEIDNVIYFACSCLFSSVEKSHVNANELLCVLVKTYRELRQIGYFLTSIRGAFTNNNVKSDEKCTFESIMNLLRCGNIMESLSMSYQTCPSGQVHEVWNFFDGWIVNIVDEKFPSEWAEGATAELAFAVQMFIIFIKNIRTNKQNSPELRSLCEKSMTTSIFKLLGTKKTCDGKSSLGNRTTNCEGRNDILMRQGFDLCGWLVDLHTRSCFWIDNIDIEDGGTSFLLRKSDGDASDEGLNVLSYLHNVMETSVVSNHFKKWRASFSGSYWSSSSTIKSDILEKFCDIDITPSLRGSLQRLALHRVHQLHSLIYYYNLQENERHASDLQDDHSSSEALTNEARKLVNLSMYIACSQLSRQSSAQTAADQSSESLWSSVAQSLSIWTHYCEPFHAELFMTWFFTTLCQSECPVGLRAQVFSLEKSITLTLARDASFYDIGQVMTVFMKVGIQFAFAKFLASIESNESIENVLESSEVTTSCLKLAEKGDTKITHEDHLDSASQALTLLSSAPLELMLCNANLSLLDRVVGLDILSSQAIKQQSSAQQGKLVNIIRSTKSIIANLLPKTLLLSSDLDAPCLANMTRLFKSCRDFKSDNGVLLAFCDAISEYFALCVDNFDKNSSMLVELFTQIGAPLVTSTDTDFSSNSILIIRSVIRRMNTMNRHHSLSKKAYETCLNFVVNTQQRLQSNMVQHLSTAGTGQQRDVHAATKLLLESEILSFVGNHLESTPETNLITTEQSDQFKKCVGHVFELITGVKRSHRSLEFINASGYFFASLASAPHFFQNCVSSSSIFENIMDLLAQSFASGQESPLLDAALCSLIRSSGLDQIKTITEYVLNMSSKSDNGAFITKIFNLMITCANNQEQHKFIAGKCKTFLLVAVGLLRDRSGAAAGSNNVKLFSKTVTTLISKKELLLLGGREIAMICCEINPLFYHGRYKDYDVPSSIFHSSCVVVASLIAHYPKQLYGQPSSLFSLLLALLSDVLHTFSKKELSLKALEYAKICELLIPHKDIFKKHVVGLILCYIKALSQGMNPTTKSKLMPSIYALLDMCSDFETRQINAMIDVQSKTLFAPVFQSYRKYYQYHGQA